MGLYKQLRQTWQHIDPKLLRERLVQWRKEPTILRVERPTKLHRARDLGYKAKLGYIIVRVRVKRGGRMRPQFKGGRRPKARRRKKILDMSYQTIAERRANLKFKNCEVLNSYFIVKDGIYSWYEVILVDAGHPSIIKDKRISWVANPASKGRAFRGLTSSGRRSRGLHKKGKGVEKHRPSQRANKRRGH